MPDPHQQQPHAHRLFQIIQNMQLQPLHLSALIGKAGQEYHRNMLQTVGLLQGAEHIITVHSRHVNIQKNQIRQRLPGQKPERRRAGSCSRNLIKRLQRLHHHIQCRFIVIHDQNSVCHFAPHFCGQAPQAAVLLLPGLYGIPS